MPVFHANLLMLKQTWPFIGRASILSYEFHLQTSTHIYLFQRHAIHRHHVHVCAASPLVPSLNINTFEIESSDDNSVRLTINFDAAFTRDNVIDSYCVKSVGGVCPEYSCVSPNSSYACEGLEAGGEYNFIVRAVNCGNQESNDTEVLTIILRGEMRDQV